jgi:hypothetical protein
MLDVATITIIVTLVTPPGAKPGSGCQTGVWLTLVVERVFDWASRIKKSKCCGGEIDLNSKQ